MVLGGDGWGSYTGTGSRGARWWGGQGGRARPQARIDPHHCLDGYTWWTNSVGQRGQETFLLYRPRRWWRNRWLRGGNTGGGDWSDSWRHNRVLGRRRDRRWRI